MKRPAAALLCLALMAVAGPAAALGIVRVPSTAVLGQPLDLSVELQLAPGETLARNCIEAEVTVGEQRLPPSSVRATVEGRQLRIVSADAVGEPIVQVRLALGCTGRVTRSFTLLADPPGATLPAPVAPALAAAPAAAVAAVAPVQPGPPVAAPAPSAAPKPATDATSAGPIGAPSTAAAVPAAPGTTDPAPASPPDAKAAAGASRDAAPQTSKRAPARRAAATTVASGKARLKLDSPEPPPTRSAAAPAPTPAPAADDAAAAAAAGVAGADPTDATPSSAELDQQLQALETAVADLLQAAKANLVAQQAEQAARLKLQQSLAKAQAQARWTPWLQALVLLLGLGLMLALWRLRKLRPQASKWYQAASATRSAAATVEAPAAQAAATSPPQAAPRDATVARAATQAKPVFPLQREATAAARGTGASAVPSGPQRAPSATTGAEDMTATRVLPSSAVLEPRPVANASDDGVVAIEELLDLEQQVAFFTLLGQDDAAVDLIVAHLRSGGVASPLPYLKLLELHQRQGDAEAYERTRSRFEKRFAASAPAWGQDLNAGRALDEYPRVMQRVQAVWPQPLDAMALLQTLLARTDGGEMFDLPAYRDLMLLYPLARGLAGVDPRQGDIDVDLLLPIGEADAHNDHGVFRTTSALPYRIDGDKPPSWESRPTAPVDLELDVEPAAPRR